jgi:hypothetical protein
VSAELAQALSPTRAEVIDKFGTLYAKSLIYKVEVEHPMEALKNQIRGWYANEPADLEITASPGVSRICCTRWTSDTSARRKKV